ncbi:hypothetical protein C8Q79DRAFT_1014856 [Trametes meyenii]|nr:hypothetical protein C8Q79DRAFT_1014856 [Trametes meyenii]
MSGAYDERLLASAPAATRAEKQEGYDVDLLDERRPARGASTTPPPLPALSANHAKAEAGGYTYPQPSAVPWYRTRKWVLILVLGSLVVIGAVVGGAVGGTVGHNNKDSSNVATGDAGGGGASGPAVSGAGGGEGQAASKSSDTASATTTPATTTEGGDPASKVSIPGVFQSTASATSTPASGGEGSSSLLS